MEVFKRSWKITKLTFSVIWKDKVMLLFPVMSAIVSLLFILAMVVPTLILPGIAGQLELAALLILFAVYLGLAFITVFFDVCVVYVTKKRFQGNSVNFSEAISFAFSKFGLIFQWAFITAIVGLILNIIDSIGRDNKGPFAVVARVASSLVGLAWSIATIFVVPSIVYENNKPIPAIKQSVNTLKQTWGESLIRYFGLGFAQGVFMVLGVIVFGILTIASLFLTPVLAVIMLLLGGIYMVLVFLVFHIANDVFNVALYEYATKNKIPGEFDKDTLENAFQQSKNRIM